VKSYKKGGFFMAQAKKAAAPAAKPAAAAPKKKWSTKKIIVVIVGAVVVLFIILLIVANAATSASVKVSNSMVNDIQSGNAAAAYALMSSRAQEATSTTDFKAAVDQIGPILAGKPKMISKEVSGETGTAATAKVVYEIQGTDSLTYTFTVNLTKENGEWKVLNFESVKK
jgi:hypothetical protein